MRRFKEIAAIAVLVLVIVGLPTVAFAYEGALVGSHGAHEIAVVGQNGQWSLSEIHVKQGEHVRLRLTSHDVVHGFALAGYGFVTTNVYPGKFAIVDFVADKPGTFPFVCIVWCNINHPEMHGTLVVDPA